MSLSNIFKQILKTWRTPSSFIWFIHVIKIVTLRIYGMNELYLQRSNTVLSWPWKAARPVQDVLTKTGHMLAARCLLTQLYSYCKFLLSGTKRGMLNPRPPHNFLCSTVKATNGVRERKTAIEQQNASTVILHCLYSCGLVADAYLSFQTCLP